VLELAQVYLNITGPHETDNTQLLKELEMKRNWSKTAKGKQENDRSSLKYHQNIPYVPRKISPDCHLGGMKWRTYNQLVNKDGIHDCHAWWTCYTWFYSGADAVLPRTNHDPTDNCCFCLCCPTFVLRISLRAKMALFLKSASFIFIPTSLPNVFNMKLAVANSNGKQEILLHTKISLTELEQHIVNYENNVGAEEKVIDEQPQPEDDGNEAGEKVTLKTTRTYNFCEITSKESKRIMKDSALEQRPSIKHRQWLKALKHHMHEGFFFIMFDPLGTTVDLTQPVPFFFNVDKLVEFLKKEFAPMSTGFLARVEEIDSLRHRGTLQSHV